MNETTETTGSAVQASGVSPITGVAPPVSGRWKKGQSGNPKGRAKNAGLSIIERVNELCANPDITCEDLERMAENPKEHPRNRAAAKRLLSTALDDEGLSREGFKTLADYTNGKPSQTVKVEQVDTRSPQEQAREVLMSMLRLVGLEESDELPDNTSGHAVVVVEG